MLRDVEGRRGLQERVRIFVRGVCRGGGEATNEESPKSQTRNPKSEGRKHEEPNPKSEGKKESTKNQIRNRRGESTKNQIRNPRGESTKNQIRNPRAKRKARRTKSEIRRRGVAKATCYWCYRGHGGWCFLSERGVFGVREGWRWSWGVGVFLAIAFVAGCAR
jgi:hypothetical protein